VTTAGWRAWPIVPGRREVNRRQCRRCQELLAVPGLPRCQAKNRIELSISKDGTL